MALPNRVRFLATDIFDTPDDGKVYEVIDGELYVGPAPAPRHQFVISRLTGRIEPFVAARRLGVVFTAPIGVVLDEENGIEPDLIFIAEHRRHIITDQSVAGPPDLVVEVLSPRSGQRDRNLKFRRYARSGVPHYWIVDPAARTLEAYQLENGNYTLIGTYRSGDVFHPELFPGLAIEIDALWL